jgi:hypothetical protein
MMPLTQQVGRMMADAMTRVQNMATLSMFAFTQALAEGWVFSDWPRAPWWQRFWGWVKR